MEHIKCVIVYHTLGCERHAETMPVLIPAHTTPSREDSAKCVQQMKPGEGDRYVDWIASVHQEDIEESSLVKYSLGASIHI